MRTFNVAAIFIWGHPYIWRTTLRHDKQCDPIKYTGQRKRWTSNQSTPTNLPSPATPLSPLTLAPEAIFRLT